ncbi:hypothetical protein HMPREF2531_00598 [Bacteroides intestinalis]|uniref:Uncharacterized protein n=1 Tax=Bacteroides intestinalis TaxID=329854 RepID=A0A139LTC2_9BACE|nr:hypothetical protein HMPREF2531_00598 [Bacteroides intestinalis]
MKKNKMVAYLLTPEILNLRFRTYLIICIVNQRYTNGAKKI